MFIALCLIEITKVNSKCCKPTVNKVQIEKHMQQEDKAVKLKITGIPRRFGNHPIQPEQNES